MPAQTPARTSEQSATGLGALTAADAEPTEGPGQAGRQSVSRQLRAAAQALSADGDGPAASTPPPTAVLANDVAPATGERASPTAHRALAGASMGQIADARRQSSDGPGAADDAGALRLAPGDAPAANTPDPLRQRGANAPEMLAPAAGDGVAAAAQSGSWQAGQAPAAGEMAAARTEVPAANRRAGAAIDPGGAGPHRAAGPGSAGFAGSAGKLGPSASDGQTAAAAQTAGAQPTGTAAQPFNTAWQSALAQGRAQAGAASAAQGSGETTLAGQIDAPVDSPLFGPALGSQLSLLARDGVRSALLQLHPAEMGPISVEIEMDGNAARIDFQALRADTRGYIEASLPALAAALQDAGLTLAGGGVFEQASGRPPQPQPQAQAQADLGPGARQPAPADSGPAGQADGQQPARRTAPRGLVDLVA